MAISACSSEEAGRIAAPHPLIVLGIDGATWDVVEPMMARQELPNFAALVERGSHGRLISVPPFVSPVVWTTFATGTFPRQHKVLDFFYPYTAGDKRIVQSSVRRRPAIWNVASEAGRTVGVVGYFVTYPPEPVNGFMVSDRAVQKQIKGSVYPEGIAATVDEVRSHVMNPAERARTLGRFVPWPYQKAAAEDPGDPYHRPSQVIAGRIDGQSSIDEFYRQVGRRLYRPELDLFISYFRLVDHASHAAWIYYDPSDFESKPPETDLALLRDLIPETYRYMDEILGELLEMTGPSSNIVVISDHGFGSGTGAWQVAKEHRGKLTGNHRPDGVWLAAGPDIAPGEVRGMTILDVTPTLLALQRLPVSRELAGRVRTDVLSPNFERRSPIRFVESYDTQVAGAAGPNPTDLSAEEESMAALRALGYVGEDTQVAGEAAAGELGFWDIDERLRGRALVGELMIHLLNNDIPTATAFLKMVGRHDPKLPARLAASAKVNIRLLEEKLGEHPILPATLDQFADLAERLRPGKAVQRQEKTASGST